MKLPEYSPKSKKGEEGVTIVKNIVDRELDWIFRKISKDDDFGLDGYIDIVEEGKYVTGKSIGIQIKTGLSYFGTKASTGWVFYGEDKHLNYYLNLDIPVIIALVNPETENVYWTKFDINSITKTANAWKIVIDESQLLNNKAKLKSVPNNYIDYTSQIENLAKINNAILESGTIFIAIDRDEIENRIYVGFEKLLMWLTASDKMIKENRGKFLIAVFGYDDDPRELYEIEEVRFWFNAIVPIFKYWGYFLYMEKPQQEYSSLDIIRHCCIDILNVEFDAKRNQLKIKHDTEQASEFRNKILGWLNEFADKYKIEERVVFEQSMRIFQIYDGIQDDNINSMRKEYGFE